MDKFCEDCIHNEVCQYGAIPPHIGRCNDKDTLDDIRPQGEWIKKSDVICLLETWADGYSYIEIPTTDAIKAIKNMGEGSDKK